MKKFVGALLATLMVLTVFLQGPVLAKDDPQYQLSEEERNYLDQVFEEREVPLEKRQILIDKLERGEVWDSMKEEYSHIKPQIVEEGYKKTTYPDGSFLVEGQIEDITDSVEVLKSHINHLDKMRVLTSGSLVKLGVEPDKRQILIDKLEKGEVWDSFKAEYKDLEPQFSSNGLNKTVYPDGSVSLEYGGAKPKRDVNLADSMTNKGTRVGAAYMDTGVVTMYFEITYRQAPKTQEGQIISVDSHRTKVIGGSFEEESPGWQTGWRNPTHSWYASNISFNKSSNSLRFWIKFYLNGDESSVKNSLTSR